MTTELETFVMWHFCPECGCENHTNEDFLGEGSRVCANCGQDWWTDIDYSDVVVKNANSERPCDELVKQAQELGLYDT